MAFYSNRAGNFEVFMLDDEGVLTRLTHHAAFDAVPDLSRDNGTVRFDESTHFSADDASALTPVLQRRILRLFQRRGLLETYTVDDMLTWQGTGGFSFDACVRIHGSDRVGRERLPRAAVAGGSDPGVPRGTRRSGAGG